MADVIDEAQKIEEQLRPRPAARRVAAERANVFCEDCGGAIPAARRQAMPGARRCVDCQRAFEGGL